VRAWLDAVLAVVLAPSCLACQRPLERPTDGPVCTPCWHSIVRLTPPLCDRCGDPLGATASDVPSLCERCRAHASVIVHARAVGVYEGALRAVVHGLKYGGHRSLAQPLAGLMRERAISLLEGASCAVPVPLHRSRQRARGFNQAADLARGLGLPVVAALRRVRATGTQADLPAHRRAANVRGAFATNRLANGLRGATAVLVDDVSTTGATLEACAHALKEAGVAEIRAITAARVLTRPR
jgi:ComF family protein